ncbi:MAG: alkaline phosphatase family protein [Acidilobaceae archaeon]
MKVLYVVIDGASDSFNSPRRVLEEAFKPNLDSLAYGSLTGLMYTIAPGISPESDAAVLSILGYDPSVYYTGRGPLEALGVGLDISGGIALRANFATIDSKTFKIIDRRVGRSLSSYEARELAKAIDGLKLSGGKATVSFKATIGHRGVLILRHSNVKLSANISNTDPAYERRGLISIAVKSYSDKIAEAKPLDDTLEAKITAELVNEFTLKAIEILESHPINKERESRRLPKANAVLLRDPGDKIPQVEPIKSKFNMSFTCIAEMPVEIGIGRALGMNIISINIEDYTREELLEKEAKLALEALSQTDAVYVHLKGPDEPGHDGDYERKLKAIEDIDKYFFKFLLDHIDRVKTMIVVTSDHSTPWDIRAHSDSPVPVMISHSNLPEKKRRYSEIDFKDGLLGVIDRGYKLLPRIVEIKRDLELKLGYHH